MRQLVRYSSQLETISNLRRASFTCLFQAIFYAIYTTVLVYMLLYNLKVITFNDTSPLTFQVLLRIFSEIQNPMFLLFTIIDTLIPILLLRSYRRTIRKLCLHSYRLVAGKKTTENMVTFTTWGRSLSSAHLSMLRRSDAQSLSPYQILSAQMLRKKGNAQKVF
ncbi:hypothetical protein DdX_19688 [Ditylenchus destructor]|uniref:Uncharacterized protein n=1 Tax=Ditylenchus destructor TaxID=166010 RepID=A0AAD4MJ30_9BILA|nr:hypothetical protein DdX_19688 [Ditylenchus destructor]